MNHHHGSTASHSLTLPSQDLPIEILYSPQLSGVALVIIGAWTLMFESQYTVLLGSSWFLIIVGLMIGTGGLIVIVCICGCYGILKEHRYFLISVSRADSLGSARTREFIRD